MEINKLKDFIKGWFIGDFEPSLLKTNSFEVAIKRYKAGESENKHHHKLATEFTVIVTGEVIMNGVTYYENDIITILPYEATDFKCITDTITVVVKTPSIKNDKYE